MLSLYSTVLLWTFVAGCGRSPDQEARPDSSRAGVIALGSGPPETSVGAGTTRGTPCPRTGRWALCSVEKRLEQSGFVVKRSSGIEPAARAGFSVPPAVYMLGKSRLEVFIYRDDASLSRDVAKLDTVAAAPRGTTGQWGNATPTFVRSGNLAAVFLSDNGPQAERLTLALSAGAPQP